MIEFFRPPRRGLTMPMLATLASAASRACNSGVKSGRGMLPGAVPFGLRARTRCRISAITAASSSPFGSSMLLLAPARGDLRKHTSARGELARERRLHGPAGLHHVAQKSIHHVLLEDSQIAISQHVHLERFQFQTQFVGHIAQRKLAMIRQTRLGANRRKLRQDNLDLVAWVLVRPGLDLWQWRLHAGRGVFIGILTLHFTGMRVRDSRSRKSPTSVTTPTACPVP